METMPDIEKLPYLEAMVIEAIKARGVEDDETREIAREWAIKDEERVEIDEDNSARARIGHNIKFAEIYRESGEIEEAKTAYWDVFDNAINEKEYDLAGGALLGLIEMAESRFDASGDEAGFSAAETLLDVWNILDQYQDQIDIKIFEKHRQLFKKVLVSQGLIENPDDKL